MAKAGERLLSNTVVKHSSSASTNCSSPAMAAIDAWLAPTHANYWKPDRVHDSSDIHEMQELSDLSNCGKGAPKRQTKEQSTTIKKQTSRSASGSAFLQL